MLYKVNKSVMRVSSKDVVPMPVEEWKRGEVNHEVSFFPTCSNGLIFSAAGAKKLNIFSAKEIRLFERNIFW